MKTHLFVSRHPHIFEPDCEALCAQLISHPQPLHSPHPDEIAEWLTEEFNPLRTCTTCIRVLLKELATGQRLYIYEVADGQSAKIEVA